MILTVKQTQALDYLEDSTTRELVFGGGAGGAKSVLGCYWGVKMCLKYPGIRGLIGRTVLTTLKKTTLQSLWWVCKEQGLQKGVHYKYNQSAGEIHFFNGSMIYLMDCDWKPSDENYDRFGSLELTWAFIDECNQLRKKAWDVIKSRIRFKLDEYGLIPKILGTCNPAKNWVYMNFYDPERKGSLPITRRFVQSLAKDNPFISRHYVEQLDQLEDLNLRARLLLGLWDYDDDPATLIEFAAIMDAFTNEGVKAGNRSVSADLAMQGRARFVAGYWEGLIVEIAIDEPKSTGKSIETSLKTLMATRGVGRSQTVVDSDGLGNYLESYLIGIREFHGGAAAKDPKEYFNIKAECGYKLASYFNNRSIRINCTEAQRDRIVEELGVLKSKAVEADEKRKQLLPKKDMVELLGRSPDYLDMLLMGMVFHNPVKPNNSALRKQLGFFR